MDYVNYLKSKEWENKKKIFRNYLNENRFENEDDCEICGYINRSDKMNVHHLSYKNIGDEKLSDLMNLCEKCHSDIHELRIAYSPEDIKIFSKYLFYKYNLDAMQHFQDGNLGVYLLMDQFKVPKFIAEISLEHSRNFVIIVNDIDNEKIWISLFNYDFKIFKKHINEKWIIPLDKEYAEERIILINMLQYKHGK